MKHRNKLCSIALVSISLISFLILVLYPAAAAQSSQLLITETQTTANESLQEFPDIYGDRIVWQDFRNGNLSNGNWDIFMYNLSTLKETRITTSESWQEDPEIYGDRIVWEDGRNGNIDIYTYNLSTRKETQITKDKSEHINPAIYSDRIVWEDGRNGNYYTDIYMYDLSTSKETRITTADKSAHIHPAIYADKIVWEEGLNGKYDIYMYNLSTNKETQITASGKAHNPAIYSNRIVWEDYRFSDVGPDIYMYNLSTSKETKISTSGMAYNSAIYGDRIVWHDYRIGNDNIYMYDISTSKEIPVTTNKSEQEFPAIYGNRIVWHDYRNVAYKPDIYVGTIGLPPVANFWGTPKSGNAPLDVTFTDISTEEPTAWNWSFGDGTYSTQQNPKHTYSVGGIYTVSLTVTNAAGYGKMTKTNYINITALQKPVANFWGSPKSGNLPLNVTFTDISTGTPTAWTWSFGDGTTNSTVKNPVHTYNKAGKYTVTLTVNNTAGSNSLKKSGYIDVSK